MKPSENLYKITTNKFIPLMCVFELTRRCNLKCRHCYIDSHKSSREELSTIQIKHILSQLAKAGTLNLVFTGGEIFLRKDILELCRYARKLSFDVRLFTNGTMIDKNIAGGLSASGISGIEISLYGRPATHDNITRSKGSFALAAGTINILLKHKIAVTIKCPLMKTNIKDYKWLARFAKINGLKFRFDPTITAKDSGDKSNLKDRLSSRQLKKLYLDPLFFQKPAELEGKPDLSCSAGINMVSIGCDGKAYPCLQYLIPLGNLKRQKFSQVWSNRNKRLRHVREANLQKMPKCLKCELVNVCQRCPGIALLEDKTLFGPSKIACEIAEVRHKIYFKKTN